MNVGHEQDFEFLGTEPRRVPRWVVNTVAAVVVIAAVAAGLVVRSANEAKDVVSQASLAAQEQAAAGQERVLSTLAYASPMIWSSLVPEDVRADLRRLVQGTAAGVVAELWQQRKTVANTRVFPWQSDVAALREEAVTTIDAQLSRFQAVAADARALATAFAQPMPVSSVTPRESES